MSVDDPKKRTDGAADALILRFITDLMSYLIGCHKLTGRIGNTG